MKTKKITGVVLIIVGIAMYLFANYITQQVVEGKHKISSAQQEVDTGSGLLSLSPYTEDVGKIAKGHAQEKIDAGQAEINKYQKISSVLHIGGILVAVAGIGFLVYGFRKQK